MEVVDRCGWCGKGVKGEEGRGENILLAVLMLEVEKRKGKFNE